MTWQADRRLYLTEDQRLVEAGDLDARWLLVAEGGELSDAAAEQYGLTKTKKTKPAADQSETETTPPKTVKPKK